MPDQTQAERKPRPVVLCILDGWGERAETDDNAIAIANTPNWDRYLAEAPHGRLNASALDVGLPDGQMGNSEVGHMTLGAGRVVLQDLPRIDTAIKDGSLAANPVLESHIATLRETGGACHLMGLMSPGGVHSHQNHIAVLAKIIGQAGVPVVIHAFLDGRDTPPKSAIEYMKQFMDDVQDVPGLSYGVVSGRYYAMDRDQRWERTEQAYNALVSLEGDAAPDPMTAIKTSYDNDINDEFVLPTIIDGYPGMKDGDGILMANFRADRARQILAALCDPEFDGFKRAKIINFSTCVGMAEYSESHNRYFQTLFPPEVLHNILGQIVAEAGMRQLRIAETEKYAHVTFFLNGGREDVFNGEERILIPSPKVATYDLQPEMSAPELTDKLVQAVKSDAFDLIVVNYANGDMVGHTGILDAAIKAAETIDVCLGRLEAAVRGIGGTLLVTADHGNCETMRDAESDQPHTAHTMNMVPFIVLNGSATLKGVQNGGLADVAPTVLKLLGLPQPSDMSGRSLIIEKETETLAAQ
ncbi:MAG: 2,3-bisphosphoglycerate-independent phosphoglycerate mutase [Rhodospirillaceae bacterium]|jgi:2,3-bisphosphoglycerate-independent phosphoglycerate mutase